MVFSLDHCYMNCNFSWFGSNCRTGKMDLNWLCSNNIKSEKDPIKWTEKDDEKKTKCGTEKQKWSNQIGYLQLAWDVGVSLTCFWTECEFSVIYLPKIFGSKFSYAFYLVCLLISFFNSKERPDWQRFSN